MRLEISGTSSSCDWLSRRLSRCENRLVNQGLQLPIAPPRNNIWRSPPAAQLDRWALSMSCDWGWYKGRIKRVYRLFFVLLFFLDRHQSGLWEKQTYDQFVDWTQRQLELFCTTSTASVSGSTWNFIFMLKYSCQLKCYCFEDKNLYGTTMYRLRWYDDRILRYDYPISEYENRIWRLKIHINYVEVCIWW